MRYVALSHVRRQSGEVLPKARPVDGGRLRGNSGGFGIGGVAFKEPAGVNIEDACKLVKPTSRKAVCALLVFLGLLVCDADGLGQCFLL